MPYFLEMCGKIFVFLKIGDNLFPAQMNGEFLSGRTVEEAQMVYDQFAGFLDAPCRPPL